MRPYERSKHDRSSAHFARPAVPNGDGRMLGPICTSCCLTMQKYLRSSSQDLKFCLKSMQNQCNMHPTFVREYDQQNSMSLAPDCQQRNAQRSVVVFVMRSLHFRVSSLARKHIEQVWPSPGCQTALEFLSFVALD